MIEWLNRGPTHSPNYLLRLLDRTNCFENQRKSLNFQNRTEPKSILSDPFRTLLRSRITAAVDPQPD